MSKIAIAIVSILILLSLIFIRIFYQVSNVYYGHHFTFENHLNINIDSLKISIGNETNWLYSYDNNLTSIEGKIEVPEKGYPHLAKISVFGNGVETNIPADSFDCYSCDGYHYYILRPNKAEYKFRP